MCSAMRRWSSSYNSCKCFCAATTSSSIPQTERLPATRPSLWLTGTYLLPIFSHPSSTTSGTCHVADALACISACGRLPPFAISPLDGTKTSVGFSTSKPCKRPAKYNREHRSRACIWPYGGFPRICLAPELTDGTWHAEAHWADGKGCAASGAGRTTSARGKSNAGAVTCMSSAAPTSAAQQIDFCFRCDVGGAGACSAAHLKLSSPPERCCAVWCC
mmetsp:Transcript_51917/g.151218  ORF Transcript_51917/g.151218 Transcript_51917/m.151218 type:complete len:218 (-) Transcript_51917:781-1434(-)